MTFFDFPTRWESSTLSSVIELISGQHIEASDCNTDGHGVPYLTGPSDFNNGEIRSTKFTEVPQVCCKVGDILLTVKGSGAGTTAIADADYCISRQLMAVRARNADIVFIRFVLESHATNYKNLSAGLIPGTARGDVLNTRLGIPPLNEQAKIGKLLLIWSKAIEKTEQLIAAKVRAKDAYGIFLLSTKHPNFRRADELFAPVSEKGRDDLQILSVTQDQGVIPRALLDKQILMEASNVSAFKVVREGDFVISLRSFQGGLEYSPYEGVVSPAYTVLRPREEVYPEFFRHYLKSKDFLKRLSVAVIGIRDGKQINFSDFASIKLPVPPRVAQVQYAELFDAMEREIVLLKTQKDGLQKQKRGLMQKLLTGQWRVMIPTSKEISDA